MGALPMNNKNPHTHSGEYNNQTDCSNKSKNPSNKTDCKNYLNHSPLEKISLRSLIGSSREVIIEHNNEDYCLRRTNRNKLILTKVQLSVLFSSMFFSLADS